MKTLTILTGAVVGAAAATLSAGLFGAGVASAAPDVVGQPFSDAETTIQQTGGTAIVATKVGDKVSQDDCIVTNVWNGSFVRDGAAASGEVMVALNCNGHVASAGSPGNSAASPAGREAKAAQDEAAAAAQEQLAEVSTPGG